VQKAYDKNCFLKPQPSSPQSLNLNHRACLVKDKSLVCKSAIFSWPGLWCTVSCLLRTFSCQQIGQVPCAWQEHVTQDYGPEPLHSDFQRTRGRETEACSSLQVRSHNNSAVIFAKPFYSALVVELAKTVCLWEHRKDRFGVCTKENGSTSSRMTIISISKSS
jgi:hypothetical protein